MVFSILSHTADAGFRIKARSSQEAIRDSILALFTIIIGKDYNKLDIYHDKSYLKTLIVAAGDLSLALRDLLEELLFLFEEELFVPVEIRSVSLTEKKDLYKIAVKLGLRKLDVSKYNDLTEVKAITYHNLLFKEEAGIWQVQVIVDL